METTLIPQRPMPVRIEKVNKTAAMALFLQLPNFAKAHNCVYQTHGKWLFINIPPVYVCA